MFREYDQYDATGLAQLIAARQVTTAEVLEAALAKIDAGEPKINAMAADLRDRATGQLDAPSAVRSRACRLC